MKGRQSADEEHGLIAKVPVPTSSHPSHARQKLKLVGASAALLLAGAAVAYLALPQEHAVTMPVMQLDSSAFVIPDEDEMDHGEQTPVPPFSDFDSNGDGSISTTEYLDHVALLRDDALKRVQESELSQEEKDSITQRLNANYIKESGCITQLSNRDVVNNGELTKERFHLFYRIIDEFCIVDDVQVPERFQPVETQPPETDAPANQLPESEPYVQPNTDTTNPGVTDQPQSTDDGAPTYPSEPQTDSPMYPTDTEMPVSPGEPQTDTPMYPTDTEMPVSPGEPQTDAPMFPTDTEMPVSPGEPQTDAPMFPTDTEMPVSPGEPQTDAPAQPSEPQTDAPMYPTDTEMPVSPGEPQTDAPAQPSEPQTDAPAQPSEPQTDAPVQPSEPQTDAPAQPSEPQTDAPAQPSEPQTDAPILTDEPEIVVSTQPSEPATEAPDTETPSYPKEPGLEPDQPIQEQPKGDEPVTTDPYAATQDPYATNEPTTLAPLDPVTDPYATDAPATVEPGLTIETPFEPITGYDATTQPPTVPPTNAPIENPLTLPPSLNPLPLQELIEGQAIKCDDADGKVYRFASGIRRLYPTAAIAASWDQNWEKNVLIDCSEIKQGENMNFNHRIIPEGQAVKCSVDSEVIYRYTNGTIRMYPDPPTAMSWDPTYENFIVVDCSTIPIGSIMPIRLPQPVDLEEGQAIKCDPFSPAVFRYSAGLYRWYPNPIIAASWDQGWTNLEVVDCSSLVRGADMAFNQPPIPEGQSVKCDETKPHIYRYTNGTVRWYPNPHVAHSWDTNYANYRVVECSGFPRGPEMLMNPNGLHAGTAIKCDPESPAIFRYVDGQYRWYPNPTIAASWDPRWVSPIVVDCSIITRGDDMEYNQPILLEGQAIKCDASSPAIYRYMDKLVRWYPNPTIAASWDPEWAKPVLVDCSKLTPGPDMKLKLPSPSTLSEGDAMKCDPDAPEIYRYTAGKYCLYPNPRIAGSWDPNWASPVAVDCTGIPKGEDMELKIPSIPEGQAVKCDAGPKVYRFTGGKYRWYPNPEIAASWDAHWTNSNEIDCSLFTEGDEMPYNQPALVEGLAVRCDSGSDIFRYTEGTIRLYPTAQIAESWDPHYDSPTRVYCDVLTRGPDMKLKLPPPPPSMPEGQAIKCDPELPNIYRFTGGQYRWYPNPSIADSWDSEWTKYLLVDCSSLTQGDDMEFNQPYIPEGHSVKCGSDGAAIFRYVNGTIHWYPTPAIAESWDPIWSSFLVISCAKLERGDDMTMKYPIPTTEGQAIKCDPNDAAVYRYTGAQYRWYPNPVIATSWDEHWDSFTICDCSNIKRGPDMPYNQPFVPEGQAVKCDSGDAIYRYMNGTIHLYPNPRIAASWDPKWDSPIFIYCPALVHGPDIRLKLPPPSILTEGQAMRCDPSDPAIYRYTSGERRWYPNPPIAASWDAEWANPTDVDCENLPQGADMALKPAALVIPEGWTKLDGKLVQVSFDGKQLCGVNAHDEIFCATENLRGPGTKWRKLPGLLVQIQVYGNSLFGVNRHDQIYHGSANNADPGWVQLPGALKQITTDHKQICGVNVNDDIFCADTSIRSTPNWRQLPGKLSHVNLLNGVLFGVSSSQTIFTGRVREDPKWKQVVGLAKHLSYDGGRMCACSVENVIWCANDGLLTNPNWTPLTGKFTNVVINSGDMYATDEAGNIFYHPSVF